MTIKPWREIAKPHKDVLEGTFKQSEFAADISQVASGSAPPEYGDPEKFFARTFITEGMWLLLISVAQRLSGNGGDPVIQLQTAFGGGKTHTMLGVYHMASGTAPLNKLYGVPGILNQAGIGSLPASRVAVIDGINLSPGTGRKHGNVTANTLWGELAVQLLGENGYERVRENDRNGASPGKDILIPLLKDAAPCVVLIDELVAYIRQLEPGKEYKSGSFESNLSFIQALTEAMKSVPNACLLATLPESNLEAGGPLGQRALNALEKYFARVESVWKPVGSEESFEIVRRRLFDTAGDDKEINTVCRGFAELYQKSGDTFPRETRSGEYEERLRKSYPIHPEIFDRLYEDWSTLEKFQRTRGVLQFMAAVIHRLWNADNRDYLIMPGSLPLEDVNVRTKSLHYLPPGWEPVIEREVDGPKSEPCAVDGRDTRIGGVQAARRVARTIFLGSAPSFNAQMIRGIETSRIMLGSVQPGQSAGVFGDALKRLRDRLHYLYVDQDRYRLDTRPNLRREMESRKRKAAFAEEVIPLIKTRLIKALGRNHGFGGVHVFTPSADIPDDTGSGPRLVVLPPIGKAAYAKTNEEPAFAAAEEILRNRGDQPRQKQNRLIFLAADDEVRERLTDQARIYLAWTSIVRDIDNEKLNLDLFQIKQAKNYRESAETSLLQLIRETYKWLICPLEEFKRGKPVLIWEAVAMSTSSHGFMREIESRLKEEEWLADEWAPLHLRNILERFYFKDGAETVSARKVWLDTCQYLYLPRLKNEAVFKNTAAAGIAGEDFFGYASAAENDGYAGFAFGEKTPAILDDDAVFIERNAAAAHREKMRKTREAKKVELKGGQGGSQPGGEKQPGGEGGNGPDRIDPPETVETEFYATVNLDPVKAALAFSDIMGEVVQHFTTRNDTNVTISVEIRAESKNGFDDTIQRTVKENCGALKFNTAEFE